MKNCARLNVWGLGLALGVVWGVGMLITGLFSGWCEDWGREFVAAMGSVYVGYSANFLGSIIGLAWGFLDGFVGGAVIAWLYNCFSQCGCRKCEPSSEHE